MEMNNGVRYVVNILISMISRGHIVGVSFKDKMETVFRLGLTVGSAADSTAAYIFYY